MYFPKTELMSPMKHSSQQSPALSRRSRNTNSNTNFEHTVSINRSKAFHRYSFGKDARFKDPKIEIDVVQYDLPDTVQIRGAVTRNKGAGFGVSIPDRFFDLKEKKKNDIPPVGTYFEEIRDREFSNDDMRSLHNSHSRRLMHSVIEKNKYSSLDHSGSQLSLQQVGRTSDTKDQTKQDYDSTAGSQNLNLASSVNLKRTPLPFIK